MSFKSILSVCALAVALVATSGVQAQEQEKKEGEPGFPVMILAVLDTNAVLTNAKSMINIREQMEKYQSVIEAEVEKKKEVLKKEEEELNRKRTLLAPEQFAEERKKLQNKAIAFQREVQEKGAKLNQVRVEATNKVGEALQQIVGEIVAANRITVVVHKQMVAYSIPGIEISNLALQVLDQRLPAVQVADPNK